MGVRIIKVDEYERRQRKIIILLIIVMVSGFAYFLYDNYQNTKITLLPANPSQFGPQLAEWKEENFIRSFDIAHSTVIVDEEQWNIRTEREKLDFVTQLARYCAKKNRSRQWTLQVLGFETKQVLGEIGKKGLRVE
jgi:hypothetical protein